jgi:2'-5' RNA ligase
MKYLVAIPVPQSAASLLSAIKERLRPVHWRETMPPHITLLAPGAPLMDPADAVAAFSGAALPESNFTWHTRGVTRFNRRHRTTLVITPDDPLPLQRLFDQLVRNAPWQNTDTSTGRNFEPHITLINQLPTEDLPAATAVLESCDLGISFTPEHLCLYHKQTSWPEWKVLAIKPLKNADLHH